MNFRQIKDAIINNVLGPAELGRYRTVGYQRQVKAADEVVGSLRSVQVYYSRGNFPKNGGRPNGPVMHDMTFNIDFTVAAAAAGDLSVLQNPESTPAQRAAALVAFQEASARADESLDELFEVIYQILMDGRNLDLGLPIGTITNKWIDQYGKDTVEPQGEYVVLTGSALLTCRTAEEVPGDSGVVDDKIYNFEAELPEDDIQKTGVEGKLGG